MKRLILTMEEWMQVKGAIERDYLRAEKERRQYEAAAQQKMNTEEWTQLVGAQMRGKTERDRIILLLEKVEAAESVREDEEKQA